MRFPERETLAVGGVLAAAVGVGARFVATGPLWLDEALSVNIATLPLAELTEALRHDGSPPLYYLLLRGWIDAFGAHPLAVRGLSALFGVLTIAVAWGFAREVAGTERVAWTAALLVATSPFAMRYSAEARMYALVMLLVAAGAWALARFLRRPGWRSGVVVGLSSGLLLLTHYWSMYLLAVVGLWLLARRDWRAAGVLASGAVLFVPWLPSFLYQLRHTGTPWAPRPPLGAVFDAVQEWSGTGPVARLLFVLLLLLAALGVTGRGVDAWRVDVDVRGRALGRRLAVVTFGTLLLGILAGLLLRSGYAARYSAVVVVPFLVLAATGAATLLDRRVFASAVAAAAVLGVVTGVPQTLKARTQARVVAGALGAGVADGDVVVYCPDQLGPAVSRELGERPFVRQVVFPTGAGPQLVDWVDYADRNDAADPVAFADDLVSTYPEGSIWLVVAGGYRTYEDTCEELAERLRAVRREQPVVRSRSRYLERMALVRFGP